MKPVSTFCLTAGLLLLWHRRLRPIDPCDRDHREPRAGRRHLPDPILGRFPRGRVRHLRWQYARQLEPARRLHRHGEPLRRRQHRRDHRGLRAPLGRHRQHDPGPERSDRARRCREPIVRGSMRRTPIPDTSATRRWSFRRTTSASRTATRSRTRSSTPTATSSPRISSSSVARRSTPGTEVNDELPENTAFFGQAAPNTGVDENGVIGTIGTDLPDQPGFLPPGSGGILDDPRFRMGDFLVPGYPFVKISFSAADAIVDDLAFETDLSAMPRCRPCERARVAGRMSSWSKAAACSGMRRASARCAASPWRTSTWAPRE